MLRYDLSEVTGFLFILKCILKFKLILTFDFDLLVFDLAGIYLHIPFCKQACYYCNFHFSTSLKWKKDMMQALKTELLIRAGEIGHQKIETIYFGGGTPSLLSINELNDLLKCIYENYDVVPAAEITLETNPDDLSEQKIRELSNSSVNRLSIGIQSFFDEDLKFMNRAHTAEESKNSLERALKYFDNITIDLIYGVPGMTSEKWLKNLQITFDYGIPHISGYALTVEEKTALHSFIKRGKVPSVDESSALDHFKLLVQQADIQGFTQYEISNFGKSGYFSKHNTSYWSGAHYLGIGPSAHSFNGLERAWNISNNIKYIKALQQNTLPFQVELLSKKNRFNEYIMTGLRTISGVSVEKVNKDFGPDYASDLIKNAQSYIDKELMEVNNDTPGGTTLKITKKGMFLADGIASGLFII